MSNQNKPILDPKTQAFIDALDAQTGSAKLTAAVNPVAIAEV